MKKFPLLKLFVVMLSLASVISCSSSDVKDALDIIDVDRKELPYDRLAINAFLNDARFGTTRQQLAEIQGQLKLSSIRMLLSWDNAIQPTPNSPIAWGFFDSLVDSIPNGMDAIVVVAGVPSWMSNSANWIEGNPRTTWVDRFFSKAVQRYANNPHIIGWEVFNEPNNPAFAENSTLGFLNAPALYVEMLSRAYAVAKQASGNKLVINAATTAINQNYNETLEYNRGMRDAAIDRYIDVYGIHYYGKQFENVVRDNGVADFLNGLPKPIWITESGAQGVNKQLAYGETTWPFLIDKIPGIQRIYIYQFTDASPADVTYGLRTLDPSFPVSDLYVKLRDTAR